MLTIVDTSAAFHRTLVESGDIISDEVEYQGKIIPVHALPAVARHVLHEFHRLLNDPRENLPIVPPDGQTAAEWQSGLAALLEELVAHIETLRGKWLNKKEYRGTADVTPSILQRLRPYMAKLEALAEMSEEELGAAKADDVQPEPVKNDACDVPSRSGPPKPTGENGDPPKRAWIQEELDSEIESYKANRASNYSELIERVEKGDKGAKQAARKIFGRNVIVLALGVKSPTMVSRSPVWQGIRDALGLGKTTVPRKQIGLDVAVEEHAKAECESEVDKAIRRETIGMVRNSTLPIPQVEATIEKLTRGDMTDDEAREMIAIM